MTAQTFVGARVSRATLLGDASLPAESATGAFIAAISWQPPIRVVYSGG